MDNKVTVSLEDLSLFLDLLIMYGKERDLITAENAAWDLKSIFFGEDPWIKEDFRIWANGQIEYK